MSTPLPNIPESECTPLVRQLLDIIQQLQNRIQELEDEILRFKGLKTRPIIAPSRLETPPRPPRDPGQKRLGSAKLLETAQLAVTHEVIVPLADTPPGSIFKGYENFVVQDIIISPNVIRYRREHWETPDGQNLVAEFPAEDQPDTHFGPTLISFIIHQHVTQPLLWEQLDQLGIDISTGQLSRILTEGKNAFHQEKADLQGGTAMPMARPVIEVITPKPEAIPDQITTKTANISLKLIPAGTFMMGSPNDQGGSDERPQHEVKISKPFYLGIYPVTQGQYAKLVGKNPSYFASTGGGKEEVTRMDTSQLPVEQVSWDDAVAFCNAMSKADGLSPYYESTGEHVSIAGGAGYRLPTEAEWEYACRAGTTTPYSFVGRENELIRHAWFDKNADGRTRVVGEMKSNPFGLHDMHGNVWEWTWDPYEADYYFRSPDVDPQGPAQAANHVIRGGGWGSTAAACRSAFRSRSTPGDRDYDLGFRLALGQ